MTGNWRGTSSPPGQQITLAWLVLGHLLLAILACWSGVPVLAQKVELVVLSWVGDSYMPLYDRYLRAFEVQHPGVRVTHITTTGEGSYWTKLKTMLAAGVAPDVFFMNPVRLGEYIRLGAVRPINDLAQRDRYDLEDFFLKAREQYTLQGQLYVLPYGFGNRSLGYDAGLLDQTGLARLPTDWASPQWTFTDARTYARKLTLATDAGITRYGLMTNLGDRPLGAWLYSNGATHVRIVGSEVKCALGEPDALEVLEFLQTLMADEAIMAKGGWKNLASGKAAIAEVIPANVIDIRTAAGDTLEWEVAPWPAGRVGHRTGGGGTGWALSSQTAHLGLAWELYKTLTGRELQFEMMIMGHLAPGRRSVAFSREYRGSRPPATMQVFAQAAEYVQADAIIANWEDYWRETNSRLAAIWNGTRPARTVVEEIVRDTAPILRNAFIAE